MVEKCNCGLCMEVREQKRNARRQEIIDSLALVVFGAVVALAGATMFFHYFILPNLNI